MERNGFVIGVDFGTSAVRAIIVNTQNGKNIVSSEFKYPRWEKKQYCKASIKQFRQHPKDYLEGLEYVIKDCLDSCSKTISENIKGLSIDTTGSSPVAVDENGQPLALQDKFAENPNAMFFLWKDHTAIEEAEYINEIAKNSSFDYLRFSGGLYSSEWFWSKLLYVLKNDAEVSEAMHSWVEHCDWMPYLLTGETDLGKMRRSTCAAGHKALWSKEHNGFPSTDFFDLLDPRLKKIKNSLSSETYPASIPAGKLCEEWANRLGLSRNVFVGVGALDAHMGAVGAGIKPYYLSKVMGTSTCDMLVVPVNNSKIVKGICGQADSSIIPGMIGMEAGQSAFGDIFSWFADLLLWSVDSERKEAEKDKLLECLNKEAEKRDFDPDAEIAVDWFNGRRTPDVNPYVRGGVGGLDLASDAVSIFRSLVESTCFGARRIIERFVSEGIPIEGVIGSGGVALKSPFIMQVMADVLGLPIRVSAAKETTAMGAAMFAATMSGIYKDVSEAMENMGAGFSNVYLPDEDKKTIYDSRYQKYKEFSNFLEEQLIFKH
ncbi:MAG: ribulokinase [Salinimicrobium sp.]